MAVAEQIAHQRSLVLRFEELLVSVGVVVVKRRMHLVVVVLSSVSTLKHLQAHAEHSPLLIHLVSADSVKVLGFRDGCEFWTGCGGGGSTSANDDAR
jgi:hypothetical protein